MSGRCLLAKTADAGSQGRLKCARAMKKNTNNLGLLVRFRVKTVVLAKEGTTVGKRILDLKAFLKRKLPMIIIKMVFTH